MWPCALERRHENELRKPQQAAGPDPKLHCGEASGDLATLLDDDDRDEASANAELAKPACADTGCKGEPSDAIEQIIKQSKLIVTGDQFSKTPLPYLIDSFPVACDVKPRWQQTISDEDIMRGVRLATLRAATLSQLHRLLDVFPRSVLVHLAHYVYWPMRGEQDRRQGLSEWSPSMPLRQELDWHKNEPPFRPVRA